MVLIKNIFKSIAILFGIVLLVFFFCVGIMMIGGVEMFGYKWVGLEVGPQPIMTDVSDANKIYIQTKSVAVEIKSSTTETNIGFRFHSVVQGVVKTDSVATEKAPIFFTYGYNDGVYEIITKEPNGLLFNNDSKLTIYLPATMNITDLSIFAGTGNITFEGTDRVVDNFTMVSKANLKEYTISEKITVNNTLSLTTSSGRYYIKAKTKGDVLLESDISTFVFESNVGKDGSLLNVKGRNPSVEVGDITKTDSSVDVLGDLHIDSAKGLVKISGRVYGAVIMTNSPGLEMHINTTSQEVTATDGFSKLFITNLLGDATIAKKDGYLKIENSKATNLVVTGNKGAVEITNLYGNADITNAYGEVKVNYANGVANKNLRVVTTNGYITVTNIKSKVNLESEKGIINTEFNTVTGENTLKSLNNIDVKVVDNNQFNLITTSKTGNVKVSLGSANFEGWGETEAVDGLKTIVTPVNGGNQSNTLNIQTEYGRIDATIL